MIFQNLKYQALDRMFRVFPIFLEILINSYLAFHSIGSMLNVTFEVW